MVWGKEGVVDTLAMSAFREDRAPKAAELVQMDGPTSRDSVPLKYSVQERNLCLVKDFMVCGPLESLGIWVGVGTAGSCPLS